jgi:hypothetical protein
MSYIEYLNRTGRDNTSHSRELYYMIRKNDELYAQVKRKEKIIEEQNKLINEYQTLIQFLKEKLQKWAS